MYFCVPLITLYILGDTSRSRVPFPVNAAYKNKYFPIDHVTILEMLSPIIDKHSPNFIFKSLNLDIFTNSNFQNFHIFV